MSWQWCARGSEFAWTNSLWCRIEVRCSLCHHRRLHSWHLSSRHLTCQSIDQDADWDQLPATPDRSVTRSSSSCTCSDWISAGATARRRMGSTSCAESRQSRRSAWRSASLPSMSADWWSPVAISGDDSSWWCSLCFWTVSACLGSPDFLKPPQANYRHHAARRQPYVFWVDFSSYLGVLDTEETVNESRCLAKCLFHRDRSEHHPCS